MKKLHTLFHAISFIFSIVAIVTVFLIKDVVLDVYDELKQARTSAANGFADRWTATDQEAYAKGVQRQFDAVYKRLSSCEMNLDNIEE